MRDLTFRKFQPGERVTRDPALAEMTPGERVAMVYDLTVFAWTIKLGHPPDMRCDKTVFRKFFAPRNPR